MASVNGGHPPLGRPLGRHGRRPKEPWPGSLGTHRPGTIDAIGVLSIPQVHKGKGPRVQLPRLGVGSGVTVKEHVGIRNKQPTILREFRPTLPQLLPSGGFLPPCGIVALAAFEDDGGAFLSQLRSAIRTPIIQHENSVTELRAPIQHPREVAVRGGFVPDEERRDQSH